MKPKKPKGRRTSIYLHADTERKAKALAHGNISYAVRLAIDLLHRVVNGKEKP